MGGGYVVWRWEEGCVRKGYELCTCGLGRVYMYVGRGMSVYYICVV